MGYLLLLSFVSGLITILSPCIWPLLPIIFSAASAAGKKRPLGLSLGIITSFTLLTLTLSYVEKIVPVNPDVFRMAAIGIISVLGVMMIFPSLLVGLEGLAARLSGFLPRTASAQGSGVGSGYLTGFFIGIMWAPCASPILAAVATVAAMQALDLKVLAVALAFACGLAVPLFILALVGSVFFGRLRRLSRFTGGIQKAFGVVMIVSALLIFTNYDKVFESWVLDTFPGYTRFLSKLDNSQQVQGSLTTLQATTQDGSSSLAENGPGEVQGR